MNVQGQRLSWDEEGQLDLRALLPWEAETVTVELFFASFADWFRACAFGYRPVDTKQEDWEWRRNEKGLGYYLKREVFFRFARGPVEVAGYAFSVAGQVVVKQDSPLHIEAESTIRIGGEAIHVSGG
jgi:hypothetical protein